MRVFLSYARRDAEAFAKRLRDDLRRAGIDVWWDHASMESRGVSFLQELRDAIAGSGRLLLVVTPGSSASSYVAAEWQFAAASCVAVTPILLASGPEALPQAFAHLHAIDFRPSADYSAALQELTRVLSSPPAPLGHLYGVPLLPANHIPSPNDVANTMRLVCADLNTPVVITSARQTTTLQGMGGVGKTVLATDFARGCETRRAFPDGVVWLRFGVGTDNVSTNMETLRSIYDSDKAPAGTNTLNRVGELLTNRACLLILDDVWHLSDVEPFTAAAGPRTRILITTRDMSIATSLASEQIGLEVFDEARSLQLLSEWARVPLADLPNECTAIAEECGYLPFALAVCGALWRGNIAWSDILSALRDADLEYLSSQLPNYPHISVFRSVKVSVDHLWNSHPLAAELLYELCVFRPNRPVPERAILVMWQSERQLSDRDARKILSLLTARSLVVPGETGFVLHDLTLDYLRATAASVQTLHEKLLRAYQSLAGRTWASGPRDGYFFESLGYHLHAAGRTTELLSLLTDYQWLSAKLHATSPAALLEDFHWTTSAGGHEVIASAIQLASHRLRDADLLPGQLTGRLRPGSSPAVDELLSSIAASDPTDKIMPRSVCLTDTTSHLVYTAHVSEAAIESVAITADGAFALISSGTSGSVDPQPGLLFVVDLKTGERLFALPGHTFDINQVAIFSDGELALSASRDNTVRLWDVRSRKCLSILDAGTSMEHVATNGTYVVASGRDKSGVHVWDSTSGNTVEAPPLDYAEDVCAAGPYAFARHGSTLVCWRFDDPTSVVELADGVEAFDVSVDGLRAVTLDDNGVVALWDVREGTCLAKMTDGHRLDEKAYHFIRFSVPGYAVSLSGAWQGDHASMMKLWRLSDGTVLLREFGHTTLVTALAASQQSSLVVTGTLDGDIKVWDLDPARLAVGTSASGGIVRALALRSQPPDLVVLREHGDIDILDIRELAGACLTTAVDESHDSILAGPDEVFFTYSSSGNTLCVADYERGLRYRHPVDVTAACFDPDRDFVWFALRRGAICRVRIGDLMRGGKPSPDRAFVLPDVPNMFRNAYGPDPFSILFPMDIAMSTDGMRGIVTWGGSRRAEFQLGGWQFPVAVFQARDGSIASINPFADHVVRMSVFCEANDAVLSATYGSVVKWSVADPESGMCVRHDTDDVFFVAVLPDGRTAVSGTTQGEIRLWSIATGETSALFFIDRILTAAALTRNAQQLVVAIRNGGVHTLQLPSRSA